MAVNIRSENVEVGGHLDGRGMGESAGDRYLRRKAGS